MNIYTRCTRCKCLMHLNCHYLNNCDLLWCLAQGHQERFSEKHCTVVCKTTYSIVDAIICLIILNIVIVNSHEFSPGILVFFTLVLKPGTWIMATSSGFVLSNIYRMRIHVLGLSNLRYVQLPMVVTMKKLLHLPILLKWRVWAIYDSHDDDNMDTYVHPKSILLQHLSPDTKEDCLAAHEQLYKWKLQEGSFHLDNKDQVARHIA